MRVSGDDYGGNRSHLVARCEYVKVIGLNDSAGNIVKGIVTTMKKILVLYPTTSNTKVLEIALGRKYTSILY